MKKLHYLLIAILFVSFASCSDDDEITIHYLFDMITGDEPAASQIDISVTAGAMYEIKGGKAPYRVAVSDENLVRADVTYNNMLSVGGHKLGTGSLIITDDAGTTKTYKVTVSEGQAHIRIGKLETNIEGGNEVVNQTIETEISNGYFVSASEALAFNYKTISTGDVGIYAKDKPGTILRKGVFEMDILARTMRITLAGDELINLTMDYNRPPPQKALGPVLFYLVEDLTVKYQEQYPAAGLTRVERLYFSSTSRYN